MILRGGRRGGFDDTFDRVCGVKMDNRKVETLLRRFPKDSSDSSSGERICQRSPRRGDPEFEDGGSSQEFVREMSISRGA